jgi:hypothetical protein
VWLATAVVDYEDGVVVRGHARQRHGDAGCAVGLRGEAVRFSGAVL